jgi:hypothetical protein
MFPRVDEKRQREIETQTLCAEEAVETEEGLHQQVRSIMDVTHTSAGTLDD